MPNHPRCTPARVKGKDSDAVRVCREESEGFLRLVGFTECRLQSEGGVSRSTSGSVALFWWKYATHVGLALLVTPVQHGRVWLCHPMGRRGA